MKDYSHFRERADKLMSERTLLEKIAVRATVGNLLVKASTKVAKVLFGQADFELGVRMRNQMTQQVAVDPNKVFVMTFQRRLACNPGYITHELLSRHDNPDLKVVVCNNGLPVPGYEDDARVIPVKRGSYNQFVEQASSRVWLDNAINCTWFPMQKKANQLYIQTWHGSLGLKRIDSDGQTDRWLRSARDATDWTDVLISNSTFEDLVFKTTYWPDTRIAHLGHARNDILLNEEKQQGVRKRVAYDFRLNELGKDVHIALYAPTFRTADVEGLEVNAIDYNALRAALEERFGGTWAIIVRDHPRGSLRPDILATVYPFVRNGTRYPSIEELMVAADVGITDYSSWICDFALTGKPAFLFAPDLASYQEDDRGFYYPLEATPFPVSETSDGLAASIAGFDAERYAQKRQVWLDKLGWDEDGHASEHVADLIERALGSDADIDLDELLDE